MRVIYILYWLMLYIATAKDEICKNPESNDDFHRFALGH